MKKLLIGIAGIALVGCSAKPTNFTHNINRSHKPIEMKVYVYQNKHDLTRAFKKVADAHHKKLLRKLISIDGYARWTAKPPYGCEIHVIRPKAISENDTIETWGHELLHCIYGEFHKDGER